MNPWGLCLQYCFGSFLPAPPSIKLLLDDPLVVNLGETITLVCVVTGGDPPPTLKWVRPGGKEVPKRSVVNRGTLTIPAVTLEDGGTYSCMASNNVGNPAKKSTNILVRGTSQHVLEETKTNPNLGEFISFCFQFRHVFTRSFNLCIFICV